MKRQFLIVALAFGALAAAQMSPAQSGAAAESTARYLESVRNNPALLLDFLDRMPKGGDLHNHLTGAVYAESYIDYAVEDGLCLDKVAATLSPAPCDPAAGRVPAAQALTDFPLRNHAIDTWSIRNFVPAPDDRDIRHHFFAAFAKFDPVTNGHWGEMLAEVVNRAGAQNEIYLETMLTPDQGEAIKLGRTLEWNDDLAAMRAKLFDGGGISKSVADGRKNLDQAEQKMRVVLGCDGKSSKPGCAVTVRYQNQILRAFPKEQVFAQLVAAFEIAGADPRVVAVDLVQSQDEYRALHDFDLQMRMLDYLHGVYPKVHIALHAGELTPGEVPPEELLAAHIRKSIELGHAERIGHGLDVIYEKDAPGLLAEMAERHILVEDCVYSHELVRGMTGDENVLPIYLRAGVPVSIATDDEGIVRSEITWYFRRAVLGYHVEYPMLKKMVRASLEHAFLPGASLWAKPDDFTAAVRPCAGDLGKTTEASRGCQDFLNSSEKAALQWKEEAAFIRFEAQF